MSAHRVEPPGCAVVAGELRHRPEAVSIVAMAGSDPGHDQITRVRTPRRRTAALLTAAVAVVLAGPRREGAGPAPVRRVRADVEHAHRRPAHAGAQESAFAGEPGSARAVNDANAVAGVAFEKHGNGNSTLYWDTREPAPMSAVVTTSASLDDLATWWDQRGFDAVERPEVPPPPTRSSRRSRCARWPPSMN